MSAMKYLVACLAIISGVLISGCGDPISSRAPRTLGQVEIVEVAAGETQCRCPGARRFRAVNPAEVPAILGLVRMERRLTGSEVVQVNETRTIPPKNQLLLQCSILEGPAGDCLSGTRIVYRINGLHYPTNLDEMLRDTVIDLVTENLQTSDPMTATGRCLRDCASGGSSDRCFVVDAAKSPDAGLAAKVANIVGSMPRSGSVPIQRVLELTKGDPNSCGRTDIATKNGVGYNYGDDQSCVISGTLPLSLGSANTSVPSNLLFNFDGGQGVGNFTLQFPRKRGAPIVKFSDAALQSRFGGRLARIDFLDGVASGEFVTNSGSNVCLAINTR